MKLNYASFQPLVSILVITYNSSRYVLETLDSTKAQTYERIELIVSDDCSTDATVELCKNWITENQNRFVRTALILSPKNTGIAPNCNRGLKATRGEWVKLIAGDDILTRDSIRQFVFHANELPSAKFLFGQYKQIVNGKITEVVYSPPYELAEGNAMEQHIFILKHGIWIGGPTSFINKQVLQDIGTYDERIPFSEDWPLYLKATHSGYKLYFFDFLCALYRISNEGIYSSLKDTGKINPILRDSIIKTYKLIVLPYLKEYKMYIYLIHFKIILLKYKLMDNCFPKMFVKLMNLIDPIFWFQLGIRFFTGRKTIFKYFK